MTLKSISEPFCNRNLFHKFLAVSAAFLVLATVSASARPLTPAEKFIQAHLNPPGSILTATAAQINDATSAAIGDTIPVNLNIALLVGTGAYYAPNFAPNLELVGLQQLQTLVISPANLRTQTSAIVNVALVRSLIGSPQNGHMGATNPSDAAAAVISNAIFALRDPNTQNVDPTLLSTIVATGVRVAYNRGYGDRNGAAGVVTGAIDQVAGSDNNNVQSGPDGLNDSLVLSVIKTAVSNARSQVFTIAKAAGYAFAGTYIATTEDRDAFQTFLDNNLLALAKAVEQGFGPKKNEALRNQTIEDQIKAGIALAYVGGDGPGVNGVSHFAFNNGNGSPMTDVNGL